MYFYVKRSRKATEETWHDPPHSDRSLRKNSNESTPSSIRTNRNDKTLGMNIGRETPTNLQKTRFQTIKQEKKDKNLD